jgi:Putative Flp pilus-assembly TadE/G-like
MSRLLDLLPNRRKDADAEGLMADPEGGIALPFVAMILVLLLGISAFAIDLGWLYLNSARLQRGADSASLAGVVYLPSDTGGAATQATNGANANGWAIGKVNGVSNGTGKPDSLDWAALEDNKLEVTLFTTVPTFFLKILGFDHFDISRTATAEYVKPVPLGSPANCFGIGDPSQVGTAGLVGGTGASAALTTCKSFTQNFWGAINGRRTAKEHGDPYGVDCLTASSSGCSGTNTDFRPQYYYGIDVPAGKSFVDIYIYDLGFYDRDSFAETGDEENLTNSNTGGTNTTFTIYNPDDSPNVPTNNTVVASCSAGSNPTTVNSGASSGTYKNAWARICRLSNPVPGIYIMKIANGGNIGGNNSYAVLANSSPAAPFTRVYAINDMSIFTNSASGTATIYLAEVQPIHAGKILELKFFDPGEGAGNATMTVNPPPGTTGGVSCVWTATNGASGSSCTINTTVGGVAQFNGEWITMQIDIPNAANYTCTTDCYWKVTAVLNTSHDRTTWTAKVIGNPVRLVPNT